MSVGNLEEIIDDNHAIVSTSVGSEHYVSMLSFVDKDQLEPGCSVLLNHKVPWQCFWPPLVVNHEGDFCGHDFFSGKGELELSYVNVLTGNVCVLWTGTCCGWCSQRRYWPNGDCDETWKSTSRNIRGHRRFRHTDSRDQGKIVFCVLLLVYITMWHTCLSKIRGLCICQINKNMLILSSGICRATINTSRILWGDGNKTAKRRNIIRSSWNR